MKIIVSSSVVDINIECIIYLFVGTDINKDDITMSHKLKSFFQRLYLFYIWYFNISDNLFADYVHMAKILVCDHKGINIFTLLIFHNWNEIYIFI